MRGFWIVLLGIAIVAIATPSDARSRHRHHHHHGTSTSTSMPRAEPEIPMDPNRWCTGGFPITDDQQIRGCTALITSRRDRELRATAYYNRGNAYFSKNDLSSAITDYGDALQIKPDYIEALYNRGVAYRAAKNFTAAIADYSRVITFAPRDVAALTGRGTAYGMKGDNQHAVADLTNAITIGTRDVNARLQRGHAYVRMQRWADALADYDQVLGTAPSNPEAFFGRACAKVYLNDLKGGNADLMQAYLLDQSILEKMVAQGISSPITAQPQDTSARTFSRPASTSAPASDTPPDMDTPPGAPPREPAPTNEDEHRPHTWGN